MASGEKFSINSKKSLIPLSYQSSFEDEAKFHTGEFYAFDICPGIGAILPIENFYIYSTLLLGSGYLIAKHDTSNEKSSENKFFNHDKGIFKFGAGYNSKEIFVGVVGSSEGLTIYSLNNLHISSLKFLMEFFVGFRI